jgi:hypothetical protein
MVIGFDTNYHLPITNTLMQTIKTSPLYPLMRDTYIWLRDLPQLPARICTPGGAKASVAWPRSRISTKANALLSSATAPA